MHGRLPTTALTLGLARNRIEEAGLLAMRKGEATAWRRVLVEKPSRKDPARLSGRTENNRVVNFDGGEALIGRFVDVVITEALPNSLRARLETR